jgi:hypothetical protein
VRAAPAVSCARNAQANAHEHTGSAEAVRPSLRNGFTTYSVLSPVRPGLLVTVALKKRELLKNLTPAIGASEPHDSAVRFTRRSSKAHPRPPLPAPTSVTMANAPSRDGMAGITHVIWVERKQEYFCKRVWTGQIRLKCSNKFDFARNRCQAFLHAGPLVRARVKCSVAAIPAHGAKLWSCIGAPRMMRLL